MGNVVRVMLYWAGLIATKTISLFYTRDFD